MENNNEGNIANEKVEATVNKYESLIGSASDEVFSEIINEKTPKEIENEAYINLKRFERDGEILWGRIYGVEQFDMHAIICVLWNGIKISIPDNVFFEKEYNFGSSYASMSEEEQLRKRMQAAKYHINAVVCFRALNVSRDKIKEGEFAGQYSVFAIGSRIAAMEVLRDIFFWHKNRKISDSQPRTIHEGDVLKAHILCVKEENILVECAGVETRIGRADLSDHVFVDNCYDLYKPGDSITVRVKSLYINADTVHLSLTGRLGVVSKLITSMKISGSYIGRIVSAPIGRPYTALLSNGVTAAIGRDRVLGNLDLYIGDEVQVYVSNIFDNYVSGSAIKK